MVRDVAFRTTPLDRHARPPKVVRSPTARVPVLITAGAVEVDGAGLLGATADESVALIVQRRGGSGGGGRWERGGGYIRGATWYMI